jgi:hypothetical protein
MFTFGKVNGWMVGLAVMVGMVVLGGSQALANHNAKVTARILYVKVTTDTDPGLFQGCPDPLIKVWMKSDLDEYREAKLPFVDGVCPGKKIWKNRLLPLAKEYDLSSGPISTGPFSLSWRVLDDDCLDLVTCTNPLPPQTADLMNEGTRVDVPCDGKKHDFYESGSAAIVKIRIRCTPLAHSVIICCILTGSAESRDPELLATQLGLPAQNDEATQIQVFDASGRKVIELVGTSEEAMSLMAKAQRPLTNGVYLATLTRRAPDGRLIRNEVRKLIVVR